MPSQQQNLFIVSLPQDSRSMLLSHCVPRHLLAQTTLYECEEQPRYLYFLNSGMASVVTTTPEGMMVEVGLIGREGFSGSLHLLGRGLVSTRCFMRTAGETLRIELTTFKTLFETEPEIRRRTLEFVQNQMLTLSQLAACNRLHTADQRLARMLLMMIDRADLNMLALTQELLSEALGARRTTVTVAASQLQKRGIIEYRRGHLRVLDRTSLKQAACACYPVVQQLYLKLYEQAGLDSDAWLNYLPATKLSLVSELLNDMPLNKKEKPHANYVIRPTTHFPAAPLPSRIAAL